MPSVTYDGRSFMLDGRRIWLVSGSIHYARVPRECWRDRIAAARHAGLNCIETPVFWSRHEPRPGAYDFEGQNDVRHFVELIGQAGMVCILRPGPYIGSGWDMGGLPAWLLSNPDLKLRSANQPFLEAAGKFLTALAGQIRDLQVTSPGQGGPLLLVQNEAHWTCGHDDEARGYLGELHRYLRENGLNVPTINSNNLWQGVEGEIDCWSGSEAMLTVMRQLSTVKPDQPRLVIDFSVTAPSVYSEGDAGTPEPMAVQRRLAEILAGCGQYNIDPFCGGTNFGFSGGRLPGGASRFVAQSNDRHAPVTEAGTPGASYGAVRRISMFASAFGKVFSHANPEYRPVVLDPEQAGGGRTGAGVSISHVSGQQGGCVFVFGADPAGPHGAVKHSTLLLAGGSTLPVSLGEQAVAWCLFDVHLTGRSRLDYTNLNALTLVGRTLVLFGPSGSEGLVSINGSPIEVNVPKGKTPEVIDHEGVTIVVCSEQQVDKVYATDEAVYLGCAGMTADNQPIPEGRNCMMFNAEGEQSTTTGAAKAPKSPKAPNLSGWECAETREHIDGSSPRYAAIDGPADLTPLGAQTGYGWYRITIRSGATRKPKVIAPCSGDRLLVFVDGEETGLLGFGPGSVNELALPLKKGVRQVVVLADNLGRYSTGADLGDKKGLLRDLWEVTPLKGVKHKQVESTPLNLLEFRKPLWEVREGDVTSTDRVQWAFMHRKKSPIILGVDHFPARAVLIVNDTPVRFLETGWTGHIFLDEEQLTRGNNSIEVAFVDELDAEALGAAIKGAGTAVRVLEGVSAVTDKADWAFAKWEAPSEAAYESVAKAHMEGAACPAWWRCNFDPAEAGVPLFLELNSLTKGQVYLNGRHLGRYWVSTFDGTPVPPQHRVWLPECWLNTDGPNELLLFDERGGHPGKCRLVHEPSGRSVIR
ncbi:MAG: hypothetical protein EA423_11295 [Phycisphaerales bacterium]|nr:MAG: hypothetical protein EA423_11295 [Phycisphaerales bacterium]